MVAKNQSVRVTFLDHVESPKEAKAEKFVVEGRVVKLTSRYIIIGVWYYASPRRSYDHNTTTFTILRSCIEKIEVAEGWKEVPC